jgi:P27 family predicted phage terminase small subunit
MRGRKPKPTYQKQLEGYPGKRARNRREPALPTTAAAFDVIPPELDGNVRAGAEWSRVAPMLRERRQITDADRTALIALCLEWARYIDATVKVAADGMVISSPNGYPMPSPYIGIARGALAACGRLWAELGMTPTSRARVKTDDAPRDAFAEFDQPPPIRGAGAQH